MGPTGSGKSGLAESLAAETGARLVNADAFQVYRGLDIGTNKPADRQRYALLDIKEPEEDFGVGEWVRLALAELAAAWEARRNVVVVGGTGLYVRALMEEYSDLRPPPDPRLRRELENRERDEGLDSLRQELLGLEPRTAVDLANPTRVRRALERALGPKPADPVQLPPFRRVKLALDPDAAALDELLRSRVASMLGDGWVEEVAVLLDRGISPSAPAMRAIGYQCVVKILGGSILRDEAETEIFLATRQYAKRQRTWLRSEPALIRLSPRAPLTSPNAETLAEALGHLLSEEK